MLPISGRVKVIVAVNALHFKKNVHGQLDSPVAVDVDRLLLDALSTITGHSIYTQGHHNSIMMANNLGMVPPIPWQPGPAALHHQEGSPPPELAGGRAPSGGVRRSPRIAAQEVPAAPLDNKVKPDPLPSPKAVPSARAQTFARLVGVWQALFKQVLAAPPAYQGPGPWVVILSRTSPGDGQPGTFSLPGDGAEGTAFNDLRNAEPDRVSTSNALTSLLLKTLLGEAVNAPIVVGEQCFGRFFWLCIYLYRYQAI